MKIVLGSDHAGFALKEKVKAFLAGRGIQTFDVGTACVERVDYPDYAEMAAKALLAGKGDLGILVCGTGLGICVAANKVRGIRAVAPWNPETTRLSREHNDANILCLSAWYMDHDYAMELVKTWLGTSFKRGGRHEDRVRKIAELEKRF